jgi:hypothetical protein
VFFEKINKINRPLIIPILRWVGWGMPIIPALRRRKQEDYEFKAILGYIVRSYFEK